MTEIELYDTDPEQAFERYLEDRRDEVRESTYKAHQYRISHFIRWCDEKGIENLNDLTGRHMQDYRYWRKQDGDLNNVSLHTQMATFRVFIKWAEDYQAVVPGLHEKIRVPKLDPGEDVSDNDLEPERALEILDYLEKFHYASRKHAIFRLLFRTGVRTGGLRTIDLEDYHSDEQFVELVHRPEQDTPLKNGESGERPIYLNAMTCQVLDDYIEYHRHDVTDDYGRRPLITSEFGRASRNMIREHVYRMTQPCFYGEGCPHDKDPSTCKARTNLDHASRCPSSEAPHSVRKASITYWRMRDTPAEQVSERANVNPNIIEEVYDRRTDMGKMEQRKDLFDRE